MGEIEVGDNRDFLAAQAKEYRAGDDAAEETPPAEQEPEAEPEPTE